MHNIDMLWWAHQLIAKEMYSAFAAKRRKMLFKKSALEAAVIYMACREAKVPRTFKELAGHTDLADKDIRHYYNMLKKALPASEQQIRSATAGSDLVVRVTIIITIIITIIAIITIIVSELTLCAQNRFCSKLRLSHAVVSLAMAIADRAAGLLEGKRPSSIAAGAILLASKLKGESRSPQDIAQAASISAATVSNIYKQLIDNQATVLPPGVSSTPTPPRF
jgi:transcription initiation factor TFIIB